MLAPRGVCCYIAHAPRERRGRASDSSPFVPVPAIIALGSNLGDRGDAIARAIEALGALGEIVSASPLYETAPMYVLDQAPFLNAAVALETELAPVPLLDALLAIERALGRVRDGERFGPRRIDLDLIAVGDAVLDAPTLTLPHPRMHERPFVVMPMLDVAPDWVHPLLGVSLRELAARLEAPPLYEPAPTQGVA